MTIKACAVSSRWSNALSGGAAAHPRTVQTQLDITSLVFELDHAGKSPVVVSKTSRATHAGGHQRRRQPQAAGGVSRRRAGRPADRVSRALPEVHPLRVGEGGAVAGRRASKATRSTSPTADPAALLGRCRALHHRRPDHRARSRDRRRHDRLSPPDAQGQKPPRRLAAFAPAHVRIPSPRRGTRQSLPAAITLGTHPLHYMGSMVYAYPPHVRKFEIIGGLFGEPYRLAKPGVQDLEVPAGAEIIIEGEILADVTRAGRPVQRIHRLCVLPQHAKRVRRAPHSHAARRDVPLHCLRHVAGSYSGFLRHARRRNPEYAAPQSAERARGHVPHRTCGAFMAIVK